MERTAWYRWNSQRVLEELGSSRQGLSRQEAEKRLKENGKNKIQEKKKKSCLRVFLEQFQDLLVWILIAAAVISAMTDNGESAVVIVAVLLLNAVLGTVEHQKAQKSLDGLRALSAPEAKVIREGKLVRVLLCITRLGIVHLIIPIGRCDYLSVFTKNSNLTCTRSNIYPQ